MGSKVHIHDNPYASMPSGADKELFKKHNPYAMTVSQMRHQWHKQLADGSRTLEQIVNWSNSPFNTGVKGNAEYKYLINDTGEDIPGLRTYKSLGMEERPLSDQFGGVHDFDKIKGTLASLYPDNALYTTSNTNNSNMSNFDYADKAKRQALIDQIYTNTLGRSAVLSRGDTPNTIEGDADYWDDLIAGGSFGNTQSAIENELTRHLTGSSEYKNRLKFVDDYKKANADANPTEAMIDAAVGPGGVLYNTASNPHTNIADQRTTNEWLQNFGVGGDYAIQAQDPLLSAINTSHMIANTEGTVPGFLKTSNPDYTKANMDNATTAGIQSGLDEAAKTWYAQKYGAYDSQEAYDAAHGTGTGTGTTTGTGSMDDFMKFMMVLAMMPRGGGGGGYGGGQYGYGGMSPGGVQAAYNPWESVQTGWDFMKNNFGSGTGSGASTATLNTQ